MIKTLNYSELHIKVSDQIEVNLFGCISPQHQFRYIVWKGVKNYDFQKVTIFTLFKLYNAGLGVLIPKRYNIFG